MNALKNGNQQVRGLSAATRSEIIAVLEASTVSATKTRESLDLVRCKSKSEGLVSQVQCWLADLSKDIGALLDQVKIGGVVGETLDWTSIAGNFKKAKLPDEVHELIARKAQEIALRQYDTVRDILVDNVCSNLACGMEFSEVAGIIDTYGELSSDVVLINGRDLQMLVSSASSAINDAAQAIAAVKRIENHIGREVFHRIGNVGGRHGSQHLPSHYRLVEEVIDRIAANELDMTLVPEYTGSLESDKATA